MKKLSQYRRSSNPCGHEKLQRFIDEMLSQYRRSSNPCGHVNKLKKRYYGVSIPPQQ